MSRHYQFDQFGGPEVLQLINEPVQPPAPGEVQVEMKAAGLNRAELLFLAGQYLVDAKIPNARMGMEGAGIVVAVGPNVSNISIGDRVCITPALDPVSYGVLGEVINAPAHAIEAIPDGVSFETAAAFWMSFGTAYGMAHLFGGLHEQGGQHVVITAASSSVGTAALQVVRQHQGISIATTRTAEKRDRLLAAGADHVIVTEGENLVDRVLEITDGKGFDIACDAVNGPMLQTLATCAAKEATIVEMGLLSGALPELPFTEMIQKGLIITAFHLSWQMLHIPDRRKSASEYLRKHLASGAFQPLIDRAFRFSDVREAYSYLAQNQQLGKVIVNFDNG